VKKAQTSSVRLWHGVNHWGFCSTIPDRQGADTIIADYSRAKGHVSTKNDIRLQNRNEKNEQQAEGVKLLSHFFIFTKFPSKSKEFSFLNSN